MSAGKHPVYGPVGVTQAVFQFEIPGLEQASRHGGRQRCAVVRMHVPQEAVRADAPGAVLRIDAVESGDRAIVKKAVDQDIVCPNTDASHRTQRKPREILAVMKFSRLSYEAALERRRQLPHCLVRAAARGRVPQDDEKLRRRPAWFG